MNTKSDVQCSIKDVGLICRSTRDPRNNNKVDAKALAEARRRLDAISSVELLDLLTKARREAGILQDIFA